MVVEWNPSGYGKPIPLVREFTIDLFDKDARYAHGLMYNLGLYQFSFGI